MDYVVTGGAGYIGGHLVDTLVKTDNVTVLDDFSRGNYKNPKAKTIRFDLRTTSDMPIPKGATIFHLAANADVRTSTTATMDHFERDVTATLNVLEAARKTDAKQVLFSSSSVIYGESNVIPTAETEPFNPISHYGLFKVMGEELMRFYSQSYGIKTVVFRFANIVGGRTTHGIIPDFMEKLKKDSSKLEILGDGKQKKGYVYISDLVDLMLLLHKKSKEQYDVFNLGNEDWITVEEIAQIIEKGMGLKPKHVYQNSLNGRGWVGDIRFTRLSIDKVKKLGWKPKFNSRETVEKAVEDILHPGR